jgi:hypothetical protein
LRKDRCAEGGLYFGNGNRMTLKEAIVITREYYHPGHPLTDQVLLMYAEDLADLDPAACIAAYAKCEMASQPEQS